MSKKVLISITIFFLFIIGVAGSSKDTCEVCEEQTVVEEKIVEKVVYKDTQETLDELEKHKGIACAYTMMYPAMFDVVVAYANDWSMPETITDEMHDLNTISTAYQAENCN